ncbi:MAG: aromatic amino acid DMT transporter YddG [Verrucomicrobiae bacterium]|nr:aromatic amino acid DMT transporter YddG [Verrucomicrobiae bacterium]
MKTIPSPSASSRPATLLGLISILFWGSSIAVNRVVQDFFGIILGPAVYYCAGGLLAMGTMALHPGEIRKLKEVPVSYWIWCGFLFLSYILANNLAVGLSADRRQVLEVSILNYLWPALTLLFSIRVFKKKTRWEFYPGVLLALAGVALALLARPAGGGAEGTGFSAAGFFNNFRQNPTPYFLGLYCGISWGLYSVLARKFGGGTHANPVPVLITVSGLFFLAFLPFAPRIPGLEHATQASVEWSIKSVAALFYMTVFVNLLAYVFWDYAMRKGNQTLVASASFFTPLLSTLAINLILHVTPGWMFWLACVMVIAGAGLAKWSVREEK